MSYQSRIKRYKVVALDETDESYSPDQTMETLALFNADGSPFGVDISNIPNDKLLSWVSDKFTISSDGELDWNTTPAISGALPSRIYPNGVVSMPYFESYKADYSAGVYFQADGLFDARGPRGQMAVFPSSLEAQALLTLRTADDFAPFSVHNGSGKRFKLQADGSMSWSTAADGPLTLTPDFYRSGLTLKGDVGGGYPYSSFKVQHPTEVDIHTEIYMDAHGYNEIVQRSLDETYLIHESLVGLEGQPRYAQHADGSMHWGDGVSSPSVHLKFLFDGYLNLTGNTGILFGDYMTSSYSEVDNGYVGSFAVDDTRTIFESGVLGTGNFQILASGKHIWGKAANAVSLKPFGAKTLEIPEAGGGLRLTSPDGNTHKILTIDNSGALALL